MTPLDRLARRYECELDPHFLAGRLARWQHREGLTDAEAAARLGVAPGVLPHLRLCRRPETAADIDRIVASFPGLGRDELVAAVVAGE